MARVTTRVALLLVAIFAGWRAVILFREPNLGIALAWAVGSASLCCLAAIRTPLHELPIRTTANASFRWPIGVASLILGAAAIGAYAFRAAPQGALIGLWALSIVLWLASAMPTRPWPRVAVKISAEWIFVGLLLALTLISRLIYTDTIPLHVHGDMASVGLQATELIEGRHYDFFGTGWAGIPIIGYWMTALPMMIWGTGLVGLNVFPAVATAATITAVYFLTRESLGSRVAVFAVLLLFGDLLLIHYGRIVAYIDPVPFIAWMMFFLLYGFRRGSLWSFAASGIMAGFAMHTYYSGRIGIFIGCATAFTILLGDSTARNRRNVIGLALAFVGFVMTLGPSLVFDYQHLETFTARSRAVVIFDSDVWAHTARKLNIDPADSFGIMREQLAHSILAFWRFNDGGTQLGIERSLLDPVAGVLLLLGLGCCLSRLRRPTVLILLLWLAGYIAAGTLSVDPPFTGRLVGQSLPTAIIGALGIEICVLGFTNGWGGAPWRNMVVALGIVATIWSSTLNWRDYLVWAKNGWNVTPPVQIARFLWRQSPSYEVMLVSGAIPKNIRELEFLVPGRIGGSISPESIMVGTATLPRSPGIFILTPDSYSAEQELIRRYTNGRVIDGSISPAHDVFHAFFTD